MTQREGRILRQGNENKKVYIYRYITEGSFDAYSWQLLETKQRFISSLLSGDMNERSGSDIESTVLDYAEVKALAVGSPLIKERIETANELTRCIMLQQRSVENRLRLEKELAETPAKIRHQEAIIEKCKRDIAHFAERRREYSKDERKSLRAALFGAVSENILMPRETPSLTYQGFSIVLPANMSEKKPFIWLQGEGRYYVELGEAQVGFLIRIDNFLESFSEHLAKLSDNLSHLKERQAAIKEELSQKDEHDERIAALQKKLEKIDKALGVDKNE